MTPRRDRPSVKDAASAEANQDLVRRVADLSEAVFLSVDLTGIKAPGAKLTGAIEEYLEICKRNGIPVAFGSDLLGELHWDQSKEFTIRQEVVSPIEIIRSATTIGAEVLRMPGKVGTLQAGAFADAVLVDGNPLKDLALLGDQGKHLSLIMKAGILHKNRLN